MCIQATKKSHEHVFRYVKDIINYSLLIISGILLLFVLVIANVEASQGDIRNQLEQKERELAAASAEADKFRNSQGEKESLKSIRNIIKKLQSDLSTAKEANRKLIDVQAFIKDKSQSEIEQAEKEINQRLQPYFHLRNSNLSPLTLNLIRLIMLHIEEKLRADISKAPTFENYSKALKDVQKNIQKRLNRRQKQLEVLQNEQDLRSEVASLEKRLSIKSIDRETERSIKWLFDEEKKASNKGKDQRAIEILQDIISLAKKVTDNKAIKRAEVRIKQLSQQIKRRSLKRDIKSLLWGMESLVQKIIHRKYNLHVLLHFGPNIREVVNTAQSALDAALKSAQKANQHTVKYGDKPDTRKSYNKLAQAAKTEIPWARKKATAARKKACDANSLTDARQGVKEALEVQKRLAGLVKKLSDWLDVAEKQRIEQQIKEADSKIQEAKRWIKTFGLDSASQVRNAVAHAKQKREEVRKKKEELTKVLKQYRTSGGDTASYMKKVTKLSTQADKKMQQLTALQSGTEDWVDNKYEEKIKKAEHAVTLAKTTIATQKQGQDFDKMVAEIRGWFSVAEIELGRVNIEAGQAGACLNKMLQQFGGFFIRGKAVLLLGERHFYKVVDRAGKPYGGVQWISSDESILKIDRDTGEAITLNPGKSVFIARKGGEKAFLDVTVKKQQFTGKPPKPPPPLTPSQVTVPRVIGLELATAEYDIKEAGLQVGNVRAQEDTQRAGVVIAQYPAGGATIPNVPGTDLMVDLTVSLGIAAKAHTLYVDPKTKTIEMDETLPLRALLWYADGKEEDVTHSPRTTWTGAPRGIFTPTKPGTFYVTATFGNFSGSATIYVRNPKPRSWTPPISHYDDDWSKPLPKPPPDAYKWYVFCDPQKGEVTYGEHPQPGLIVMAERLPGPRTAYSWIEQNCPSWRCTSKGQCAKKPAKGGDWRVLCNKRTGGITLSRHAPSSFDIKVMASWFLGEPDARLWVKKNCPSWRCTNSGQCARAPARGGKWYVACDKAGEVVLGKKPIPFGYHVLAKGFLGEPDARRWTDANCPSWRCDSRGRCAPGKPYRDTTTGMKSPFDSSFQNFMGTLGEREERRNQGIQESEAFDQTLLAGRDSTTNISERVEDLFEKVTEHTDQESKPDKKSTTESDKSTTKPDKPIAKPEKSTTKPDKPATKPEEPTIKYLIWINTPGEGGRIHAGTEKQFKTPKKYKSEWLFGMSDEYLKKKRLPYGPFSTLKEAKTKACGIISNLRYVRTSFGSVPAGDYEGKRHWIDGLGCEIKK